MGMELARACEECRETLQEADAALGYGLSETMAYRPAAVLRRTAVTQPAVLAVCIAQARHLRGQGVHPAALLGHSVGQYAALVAAGSLDFGNALRLVAQRGRLMQETVPEGRGMMVAVSGLPVDDVEQECRRAAALGVVGIACHNAPLRTVLSGDVEAVQESARRCEERGAVTMPLEVSVPFHSSLLARMAPAFAGVLEHVKISPLTVPVIDNVTARPLATDADVRRSLIRHLTAPVLFEQSLRYLAGCGVETYLHCGPGTSLVSMVRRTLPAARVVTFDTFLRNSSPPQAGRFHGPA
jgi:[acyl-carrier-protein] S-malonyltransferase